MTFSSQPTSPNTSNADSADLGTLQEALAVQDALYKISALALEEELNERFFARLHGIMRDLMYAENFFVVLYDPEKDSLTFPYFVDSVDKDLTPESLGTLPLDTVRNSVTGYLIRQGKTLHGGADWLDRMSREGHFQTMGTTCVDWLGVPLRHQGTTLGALVLQSYRDDIRYHDSHVKVVEFIARQIALVLKWKSYEQALARANSDLERKIAERTLELQKVNQSLSVEIEERKRSERLQKALFRISELAHSSDELTDFYSQLHRIIAELIHAPNLFVALIDDSGSQLSFPYYCDEYEEHPEPRPLRTSDDQRGLTEQVLEQARPILFRRDKDEVFRGRGRSPESWLGVPLSSHGKTFGVLAIQAYESGTTYGHEDEVLLTYVGRQVATVIQRKRDADALQAAHEDLEQRVIERTQQLERANLELQRIIEEKSRIEQKLEHDALHDSLTGLPNRALFMDRLSWFVARLERDPQAQFSVLFLDLDRFKFVNDTLGHHVGDHLLIQVAERLRSCLRDNDTIARLGGDEFCIIVDTDDMARVIHVAERIIAALARPFNIDGNELFSSTSIGIRPIRHEQETAAGIMRDADAAMYQAKANGRGQWAIFDETLSGQIRHRVRLENDLRSALQDPDQIRLHYQPILDFDKRRVIGFEALVRWFHPELGLIPPIQFIPIAEETGLIQPLGRHILELALTNLNLWEKDDVLKRLYLNVNLSPRQISAGNFEDTLAEMIANTGINPKMLVLEITESVLVQSFDMAKQCLAKMAEQGVKICMDDFGTGYSSLSYLSSLPFHLLKLDRSFVRNLGSSDRADNLVQSILQLATGLSIDMVAEGIETQDQLRTLTSFGYLKGQGYLFAKPLEAAEILPFLKSFQFPELG